MYDVVITMAGTGSRTKLPYNKVFFKLNGKPLYFSSLEIFHEDKECKNIILVVNERDLDTVKQQVKSFSNVLVTIGGATRTKSVYNGLLKCSSDYVIIHDGARPFIQKELIDLFMRNLYDYDVAVMGVPVIDTLKEVNQFEVVKTLDRSKIYRIQTPQGAKKDIILNVYQKAIDEQKSFTDDIGVIEYYAPSQKVRLVEGSHKNIKVTTPKDIENIKANGDNKMIYKIGHSYDIHPLVEHRSLVLAGCHIPYSKGLNGHSDADVVYHAVSESILGALGLGDLGTHFPDNNPDNKDLDSSEIMMFSYNKMMESGFEINNIDIMVFAEEPKLNKYISKMEQNIARLLHVDKLKVNVKATTYERLGVIGQGQAIASESVVLLVQKGN